MKDSVHQLAGSFILAFARIYAWSVPPEVLGSFHCLEKMAGSFTWKNRQNIRLFIHAHMKQMTNSSNKLEGPAMAVQRHVDEKSKERSSSIDLAAKRFSSADMAMRYNLGSDKRENMSKSSNLVPKFHDICLGTKDTWDKSINESITLNIEEH
ncbi:hypothetical protein Ancab_035642 [Ancistrocladus abbreviatus]